MKRILRSAHVFHIRKSAYRCWDFNQPKHFLLCTNGRFGRRSGAAALYLLCSLNFSLLGTESQ